MTSRFLIAAIVLALVGFALGRGTARFDGPVESAERAVATSSEPAASEQAAPPPQPAVATRQPAVAPAESLPSNLSEEERRDIEVFRRASSSVVFITSIALRRELFSFDVRQIPQGTGSGFVWDRDGHVVTNYHVIESGDRFSVTLSDQSEWHARVVGADPNKDLAVLEIDAPPETLRPLPLGHSGRLLVGQRVLAVGNPFGLDHSLTVGVVSALGRELQSPGLRTIRDVIQTDAAINPGNSGGPLLDSSGRLIGISTAIYSPSGASAGIGFAVPVDAVARIVPQLIEHGKVIQPGIGVGVIPQSYMDSWGIEGVAVREVAPGGPAERAGLRGITITGSRRFRFGDRIVGADGRAVRNLDDLLDAFERVGVGGRASLEVVGPEGDRRTVAVELIAVD